MYAWRSKNHFSMIIAVVKIRRIKKMLEFILIFLIIFILLVYTMDYAVHSTKHAKMFDQIPGPKTLPIIGNMLAFERNPIQTFYFGRSLANTYKKIYRIWGFTMKIVNIFNPQDIEVILSNQKHITKSYAYTFLHPWLKDGLLTSGGDKWQKRRKILTPAFHFNILRDFCDVFVKNSKRLVKDLKLVANEEIDIMPYITNFALRSICETAMGTDLETIQEEQKNNYQKAIYEIGHYAIHRLVRGWLHSPLLFKLSPLGRRQEKTLTVLHDFSTNVIRKRRKERESERLNINKIEEEETKNDDLISTKKRLAMLDLLLSAEENGTIDEDGIREEVDTFMFEGHDTTTMAITFCLMLLANNRDVQDQVFSEIEEIFQDIESLTIEKLNQMKYLERVIKEALRLYPSVIMIGRVVHEDVQLSNFILPAGSTCHIHIYDMLRNPDLYPDPNKFNPDRFLPENCAKRHPFAYIPFSAGPRNCIGQKFAIFEEKIIISAILQKFVLEPVTRPEDIIFTADLVLRNANPVKVKFVPRI